MNNDQEHSTDFPQPSINSNPMSNQNGEETQVQCDQIESRYTCELCNYHCQYPSHWRQHLESRQHQNGGVKIYRERKFNPNCPHCDYKTNTTTNMKLHYLNNHADQEERESKFKYYCKECDYGSFVKRLYQIHLDTKHPEPSN